jgi:cyclohexyl-isocyanide hydratase
MANSSRAIVLVAFPNMTQLDFTGPAQVFAMWPETSVVVAAKTMDPVVTDCGWAIVPTVTFEDAPQADLLMVPGGDGTFDLLEDEPTLAFLRRQALGARLVTSVCTGSFLLAAAGLLTGKRATSHWASLPMLAEFGVIPVSERVVRDGDRVTSAGVTSGIDFAFELTLDEFGREAAEAIQLSLEYDPAPPVNRGNVALADPAFVAATLAAKRADRFERVRRAADRLAP